MKVYFRSNKLQKLCNSKKKMEQELGYKMAKKLRRRLSELRAADNLAHISTLPNARCHELTGKNKGLFSVDLDHPNRLLFICANDNDVFLDDGEYDWTMITEVEITEIADTHDPKIKKRLKG